MINNNCNKINTKEELVELLEEYKGLLDDSMIEYLDSLINLDFSVIRDYISYRERQMLSDLIVYRKISKYNIYNRALKLFKQRDDNLKISGNIAGIEGLNVYAEFDEASYKLFDFNYQESSNLYDMQKASCYIGTISLYQALDNKEEREKELEQIENKLDNLYNQKNPYNYGAPYTRWVFDHMEKIREYEKKFNLLNSKNVLTDTEKKEIEMTNKFHELLLEDYGLTNNDFEDENTLVLYNKEIESNKTLVKKISNISIVDNIKYI